MQITLSSDLVNVDILLAVIAAELILTFRKMIVHEIDNSIPELV